MMQSMRRAGQTWIAKGLFFLLVGSFAVWGIGPIFTGGRVQTVATAGKVDISSQQVDQALQLQLQMIANQYGMSISPEQAEQLGIKRQIVQQMVMQSLFDQEATKTGLRYDRDTIKQSIASQPALRGEDGKFDPAKFRGLLQQLRMSEADYLNTIRSDLMRTVLVGSIQGQAYAPTLLAAPLYQWANERRVAEVKSFKAAEMTSVPKPTDEELQSFYEASTTGYRQPEQRSFTVARLSLDELAASVTPTEDELRQAFDAAPEEYGTAEKRTIGQSTAKDEATAQKLSATVAAGQSLKAAAKDLGLGYGEVADLTKASTFPELSDAIFALTPGTVSPLVKSPMGWHMMELIKVTPAVVPSFDTARAKVLEQVRRQKAGEQLDSISKSMQDALAGGATLSEAATTHKLPLTSYTLVTKEGKTAQGKVVEGLDKMVLEQAFAGSEGDAATPVETSTSIDFVQIDTVAPEHKKALADVKDQVIADWTRMKKEAAAAAQADALLATLKDKDKPATGLTRTGDLSREEKSDKWPATLVAAIFNAPAEGAGSVKVGEDSWVYQLVSVTRPDIAGQDLSATRDELRSQLANDLLEQFGAALRADYGVELNETWLTPKSSVQ